MTLWLTEWLCSYPEEVEVDLLSVDIFFLVYTREEILHINHHAQQPIQFLFRHLIQVRHVWL